MFKGLFKRILTPSANVFDAAVISSSASTISLSAHIAATTTAAPPPPYAAAPFDYLLVKPRKPSFRRHFAKQIRCGYKRVKQAIMHPSTMFKPRVRDDELPDYFPESLLPVGIEAARVDEKPPAYSRVYGSVHPLFLDNKPHDTRDCQSPLAAQGDPQQVSSNVPPIAQDQTFDMEIAQDQPFDMEIAKDQPSVMEIVKDQPCQAPHFDYTNNGLELGLYDLFSGVENTVKPTDWAIPPSYTYDALRSADNETIMTRYTEVLHISAAVEVVAPTELFESQDYYAFLNDDPFDDYITHADQTNVGNLATLSLSMSFDDLTYLFA